MLLTVREVAELPQELGVGPEDGLKLVCGAQGLELRRRDLQKARQRALMLYMTTCSSKHYNVVKRGRVANVANRVVKGAERPKLRVGLDGDLLSGKPAAFACCVHVLLVCCLLVSGRGNLVEPKKCFALCWTCVALLVCCLCYPTPLRAYQCLSDCCAIS